jgi:radical SAM protein with 4Fe4S-binding SPASM domain
MTASSPERKGYSCDEPWTGSFAVTVNGDVSFCPCYLKLKLGNLKESSIEEIWNSETLQEMRRDFSRGELPEVCQGQLCPPVVRGPVPSP